MKILITGGAGYIGTSLAEALSRRADVSEIVIYDNLCRKQYDFFLHSNIDKTKVRFLKANILDSRTLKKALEGVDVVYHLASHRDEPLQDHNHALHEQVNNWGTAELSYALEASSVQKVINAGSVAVYGHHESKVEKENTNPQTFYGASKLRGEAYLTRLDKTVYNLRIGNVYGFGNALRLDTFINKFVFDAKVYNRIKIWGSGNEKRPIIHLNSLVELLVALIDGDIKSDTYNVFEAHYSVLDIADMLKQIIPSMEMLFVNQHLALRNIEVEAETRIKELIKTNRSDVKSQLIQFLDNF